MDLLDARGLAVSAADGAALALYEAALASLHGARGDAAARNDAALAHDPQLVAAHCLRAAALVLAGGAASLAPLTAALDELDALGSSANDRERRHAAAARAWLDGDTTLALARYGAIVVEYPRDSLALQVAHALDFRLGHREMLRDRIAEVLPHWDASVPGYGYVLGLYAFGLEENGDYARAEAAARESLRLEPDNASAIHVIAHVMEMQGRAKEGIDWLEATRPIWTANAGFSVHLAWHLALFHIDIDATPAAITIYIDSVAPYAAAATNALIDATALLWRLELRGVNVRGLWRELAQHWARTLVGRRARFHAGARRAGVRGCGHRAPRRSRRGAAAPRPGHARGQHGTRPGPRGAADRRAAGLQPRRLRGRGGANDDGARDRIPLRRQRRTVRFDPSDAGRGGSALAAGALGAGARGRARGAQARQPAKPVAMRSREIQRLAGSHSTRRVA